MSAKVFIDGQHGTTGLQIYQRLSQHGAVEVLEIDPQERKNPQARQAMMKEADIVFLCLPDDAAREAAALLAPLNARVIDASTAHRCQPDWVYGLPELNAQQRSCIQAAQKVANPGCYATGAILLLAPLIEAGYLKKDSIPHLYGYSGYSGGGNSMIDAYEAENTTPSAFSLYGLGFAHKHIPEIIAHSGLRQRPSFFPAVVPVRQGMIVLLTLAQNECAASISEIHQLMQARYGSEEFVRYQPYANDGFLHIEGLANTNQCHISAFESPDQSQILLTAKFDNLGKGASGAAVQNMNLMLGLPENQGLN